MAPTSALGLLLIRASTRPPSVTATTTTISSAPGASETRAWVADSGWPFERSALDPYYERAQKIVEIAPFDYDIEVSHPRGRAPLWNESNAPEIEIPGQMGTMVIHFSPPTRFGRQRK